MDRIFTSQYSFAMGVSSVRYTILANGEDFTTMEDHGDMIALIMFRGVAAFLAEDI